MRFVDGSGFPSDGRVLIAVSETDGTGAVDPLGDSVTATVDLNAGRFDSEFRPLHAEPGQVVAHYLGGSGAAPGDSHPFPVRP